MSDEMQKVAEKLCHSIAGQMDANLFESIVSLFNQGVLVHYVRSPRHMVDANNFKMTVEAANGVAFEGRQRIIDLEAKLAAAQKEIERLKGEVEEMRKAGVREVNRVRYELEECNKEWHIQNSELRALLQELRDALHDLYEFCSSDSVRVPDTEYARIMSAAVGIAKADEKLKRLRGE